MALDDQWTVWDPFGESDNLTATQRIEMERAGAWQYWSATGAGDPRYFDYMTWYKMQTGAYP